MSGRPGGGYLTMTRAALTRSSALTWERKQATDIPLKGQLVGWWNLPQRLE